MIKIDFYQNGFIVKDHANYASHGNDLVCAGVSAIILGSLSWFKQDDIIECIVDDSIPIIKLVINDNNNNQLALSLIFNQINEIHLAYSKYIKLVKHQNKLNCEI